MNNHIKTRALIQSIGFIVTFIIIGAILAQIKNILPLKFERYAHGLLSTIAALITAWVFIRYDKKSFKEIGLNWESNTLRKFLIGTIAGIAIAIILIFSQILYSELEINMNENADFLSFFIWSIAFIPLAFMEEIAFRSYPFIRLNNVFGLRITQLILALLFALYHILMGWPIGTSFLGPGIWALAYGLAAMYSDGISMPTGLHFGVNFILALMTGKKGIDSIYTIDFSNEVTESATIANEKFGIGLQIGVLILCVIATELYLRRKKTTANRVYK